MKTKCTGLKFRGKVSNYFNEKRFSFEHKESLVLLKRESCKCEECIAIIEDLKNEGDCWLITVESRDVQISELQKENRLLQSWVKHHQASAQNAINEKSKLKEEIESLKAEISIYKANDRLTQMRLDDLKEANKVLREAVEDHVLMYDHAPWCRPQEGLQCICMDRKYYREEVSLGRMKQALAKADEIMGEKK